MHPYLVDAAVATACVLLSAYLKLRSGPPQLKVAALFVYPVKSLPPIRVVSARLGTRGFEFDRCFALVTPQSDGTLKNHFISTHPGNTLIHPSFATHEDVLIITYSVDGSVYKTPLRPITAGLAEIPIDMYNSRVVAWDMGDPAASFFTRACGSTTRLVYMDPTSSRPVLGSMSQGKDSGITFTDHGAFMVATTASLDAFSTSLGRPMDIVPLRPNILLAPAQRGSYLAPWSEDFWSEIRIAKKVTMRMTANCVRCVSLNIDYATGKPLVHIEGTKLPLAVLSKDRRVDTGTKAPVFGRYGFSDDAGQTIEVGDVVDVTKLTQERTTFDWPY